jgi:hypothetical protein
VLEQDQGGQLPGIDFMKRFWPYILYVCQIFCKKYWLFAWKPMFHNFQSS